MSVVFTSNAFAQGPWIITSSVDPVTAQAGTIVPYGSQIVDNGDSIMFVVRAFSGYRMSQLLVDNQPLIGPDTVYTFTNVTADHEISARFRATPPTCYSAPDTCYVCRDSAVVPWGLLAMDLGSCDTVRLGCPVAVDFGTIGIGDSIAVPSYIWNDFPVGGFSLGFHHDGVGLRFASGWSIPANSAIIVGARLFKTPTMVSEIGDTILFGWADFFGSMPIPATTGSEGALIGEFYFKLMDTVSQVVHVDSTFVRPAGRFALAVLNPSPGLTRTASPRYTHCNSGDLIIGNPAVVTCGDADADGAVTVVDAVCLVNYIFADGPAPQPLAVGDVNCDQSINIVDAVYLVRYIFADGPTPCEGCK